MEKKEAHNTTTTNKPVGSMCERLFTALNTNNTFRPLRRLTYRQQNPEPQTETQSNSYPATAATDAKHKIPSPPPPEKSKVTFTAPSFAKNDVKGSDQKDAPGVTNKKNAKGAEPNASVPVPPKLVTWPQPAPPKGSTIPLAAQPTGVTGSTDTPDTKPKKNLNEKVEDYIYRTKRKLRSTTLARTQTTK